MKNILYINTHSSAGGAAAVMQRLADMVRRQGMTSAILTGAPGFGQARATGLRFSEKSCTRPLLAFSASGHHTPAQSARRLLQPLVPASSFSTQAHGLDIA